MACSPAKCASPTIIPRCKLAWVLADHGQSCKTIGEVTAPARCRRCGGGSSSTSPSTKYFTFPEDAFLVVASQSVLSDLQSVVRPAAAALSQFATATAYPGEDALGPREDTSQLIASHHHYGGFLPGRCALPCHSGSRQRHRLSRPSR